MLDFETCWKAVEGRDKSFDGKFFFGVITTGVFCRPSCPARRPLRRNVRFYEAVDGAQADGLRACLRCRPLALNGTDPNIETIRRLCRFIESNAAEPISLADLSRESGLSPYHLQRTFRAIVGVTPKQYLDTFRMKRLKSSLREAKDVTEAIYDAGFGSASRVYERADTRLGMTPNEYRSGGAGKSISYVTTETSLGHMMIGATDRGLCFLQFDESIPDLIRELTREYPKATIEPARRPLHPDFERWIESLNEFIAGERRDLNLPLDIQATAFQMRVWNYLQQIPYGHVESYGEVAAGIGQPRAVRAVARACASNRVALIIPCHRVIRGTGELGGYKWGLPRKRVLIDRERAARVR